MANSIKQNIPFDSLAAKEEFACKQQKIKEMFLVKTRTGAVAERITRKIAHNQTTVQYLGAERHIQGEGFDRFIQI